MTYGPDYDEFEQHVGTLWAKRVLEAASEAPSNKRDRKTAYAHITITDVETLDREGGNHRISGELIHGRQRISWVIQSGNWCGTEFQSWEVTGDV